MTTNSLSSICKFNWINKWDDCWKNTDREEVTVDEMDKETVVFSAHPRSEPLTQCFCCLEYTNVFKKDINFHCTNSHDSFFSISVFLPVFAFLGNYHHTNNRQCCVCSCQLVREGCCEWVIIQPANVYLSARRLSAQLVPAGLEQQIGQAWKSPWWRVGPAIRYRNACWHRRGCLWVMGKDRTCVAQERGRHLDISVCQPLQIG